MIRSSLRKFTGPWFLFGFYCFVFFFCYVSSFGYVFVSFFRTTKFVVRYLCNFLSITSYFGNCPRVHFLSLSLIIRVSPSLSLFFIAILLANIHNPSSSSLFFFSLTSLRFSNPTGNLLDSHILIHTHTHQHIRTP